MVSIILVRPIETSAVPRASVVIQDRIPYVVNVECRRNSTWYVEPLYFFVFDGDPLASTLMFIRSDGTIRHNFIGCIYANKLVVDNTIWTRVGVTRDSLDITKWFLGRKGRLNYGQRRGFFCIIPLLTLFSLKAPVPGVVTRKTCNSLKK